MNTTEFIVTICAMFKHFCKGRYEAQDEHKSKNVCVHLWILYFGHDPVFKPQNNNLMLKV